jgi:hypothetical protein
MSVKKFDADKDFLVKDSKTINFIAGGIMLAVFIIAMIFGEREWLNYVFATGVFLVPGIISIARGRRNVIIMRINKTGFYHSGKLVTTWPLFYDADVHDRTGVGGIKDNFILDIRYYSPDFSIIYTRSIPITNKQDKADEEIVEAIKFYCAVGKGQQANRLPGSGS